MTNNRYIEERNIKMKKAEESGIFYHVEITHRMNNGRDTFTVDSDGNAIVDEAELVSTSEYHSALSDYNSVDKEKVEGLYNPVVKLIVTFPIEWDGEGEIEEYESAVLMQKTINTSDDIVPDLGDY